MIQPELDNEDLELILNTLSSFAKRRLDLDTRLDNDHNDHCPEDLIREMLGPDVGIHLAFIPTAYGGLGGGAKAIFRISENVAGIDLGIATSLLGVSLGTDPLRVGATEEQKQRWMTRVAEEGLVVAYAVTEPSAGSDLAHIKTKALPVIENGQTIAYEISGNKQFITNGGIAYFYTFLAIAPGGPSFFIVEKDTEGLTPGPHEIKHGIRASNTTPLSLDNVRVPADYLIGGVEGQGLTQAAKVFGYTRVMVAAFGLGCGVSALNKAVDYGRERFQGGSLLCEKPGWTHKLIVPHAVALEAARAHIEFVADRLDQGLEDLAVDGAVAKLTATEAGNAAAEAAIQAHGGYGYINAYEVEKLKRDVRITCIYEGTSEICQRTIAQDRWRLHLLSKGDHFKKLAREMDELEMDSPDCGARMTARAAEALAEILEVCRQARLTRNQHVLFSLGLLISHVEVAATFARKSAKGEPDTSRLAATTLSAMSRLWSRRVAQEVASDGLALIAGCSPSGNGALTGEALRSFEKSIKLHDIHDGMAGMLGDLGDVARALYTD
jgi:alkylation response protein AidB-like acyl-CoA dehydrogenase